ncbi:MAG: hypothetical protein WBD31_23800 [Rubripirellula sp.]
MEITLAVLGDLGRYLILPIPKAMRYSIRTIVAVTTLLAVGFAYWHRPTPIDRVRTILRRDSSKTEKLAELSPYLSLGDHEDDINRRLVTEPDGYRCGFTTELWSYNCGLRVEYLGGRLVSIGCNDESGFHQLTPTPAIAKVAK